MLVVYLSSVETVPEPRPTSKALEAITLAVAKSKKAVVLVGAGISTNAGIPDFRSKGTGLYSPASSSSSSPITSGSTLKGPSLFSSSVYASSHTTTQHLHFLSTFKSALDSITSDPPTATHGFLNILKKRGQLRRVYTQNIDGLEEKAGLRAVQIEGVRITSGRQDEPTTTTGKGKGKEKVEGDFVQLHGSIHRVRCTACDYVAVWTDKPEEGRVEGIAKVFARGQVAECPRCEDRAAIRAALSKRSLPLRSFLRPAITLYDEASPASVSIGSLSLSDLTLGGGPDLMLVMGTSLKIPGFKKIAKEFAKAVKAKGGVRVLVNREEIKGQEWKDVFDYHILADSDTFVNRVVGDWKRTRPRDWVGRQTDLLESFQGIKKGLGAASKKPCPLSADLRKPLRSLSSNSPLLPPTSSPYQKRPAPASRLATTPSPSKRARRAPSPAAAAPALHRPPPSPSPPPTPTYPRLTRTSLKAAGPRPEEPLPASFELVVPSSASASSSPARSSPSVLSIEPFSAASSTRMRSVSESQRTLSTSG
ncbi:hypothetical protein JCM21900_004446 [Sporobolomyces salmonicolor]